MTPPAANDYDCPDVRSADAVRARSADRFCAYSVGDKAAGEDIMKMRPGHNDMLDVSDCDDLAQTNYPF